MSDGENDCFPLQLMILAAVLTESERMLTNPKAIVVPNGQRRLPFTVTETRRDKNMVINIST